MRRLKTVQVRTITSGESGNGRKTQGTRGGPTGNPRPCLCHDRVVRSRMTGMWWGTAIEAPDPLALASFYSLLLGWPVSHQEPGTAIVAAPEGPIYIVFQEAHDYQPPVWPPVDGAQRTMMHLDFQVGDLD